MNTQRKVAIFLVIALLVSLMPMVSVFAAADYPVYLRNDLGWTDVRVYYEGQSGVAEDCQWPGIEMTKLRAKDCGSDVYKLSVPVTAESIVFTGKDAEGNLCQSKVIVNIQFDTCYYLDVDGNYYTYCFENAILNGHVTSENGDTCDYEVVELIPPTCEVYGYCVMECIYCGNRKEEWNAEPLGHTPEEGSAYTREPSCELSGGSGYTCATCGKDVFNVDEIALGHTPKNGTERTLFATCTEPGSVTAECEVCSNRYETEVLEPTGHALGDSGVCGACGVTPIVIVMHEAYGDTWNGNKIEVRVNGEVSHFATIDYGSVTTKEWSIPYNPNYHYDFYWVKGSYPGECSFEVLLGGEVLKSCTRTDCGSLPNGEQLLVLESQCDHNYVMTETVPATCIQGGHTVYTCSGCEATIYQDVTDALGHSFSGGSCTTCGEPAKIVVTLRDEYTDGWTDAALQLFVNGTFAETLTVENYNSGAVYTLDYNPMKQYDFQWTDGRYDWECSFDVEIMGEIVFSATTDMCGEFANGETVFTVESNCSHSCTTIRVAPTCTEYGYDLNTCTLCGLVYKEHYIRPLSHTYGSKETVAPTCLEEGYTKHTCTTCGHARKTNFVECLPHTYSGDRCSVCQSRRLLTVEMSSNYGWYDNRLAVYKDGNLETELTLRFDCEGTWSMTYDPQSEYVFKWVENDSWPSLSFRILLDGETVYAGDNQRFEYTDGQVIFSLNSTCTHEGTMTEKTVAAACDEDGFTLHYCTACGYSYRDNFVPGPGHSYNQYGYCSVCYADKPTQIPTITASNISLLFEDEIFMKVYFEAENTDDVANYGIAIYPYQVDDPYTAEAEAYYSGYEDGGSYFTVRTPGIAPKNMSENVYFAVYADLYDGTVVYSKVYYYSPLSYANSMLSKSTTSANMKALIVAMLNYGAAAQQHFDYKADTLVNAGLTDAQKALVSDYSSSLIADVVKCDAAKKNELFAKGNTAFVQRNPSVSFEGAFALNFYFGQPKAEIDGDVTFYYWRAETYASVDTLELDNADGSETCAFDGTYYVGIVPDIAAKEVDETIYCAAVFTGSDGETYTSGIVAYSLGAYLKNQAGKTGTMAVFAQATGVYSYYAKQQFNQ